MKVSFFVYFSKFWSPRDEQNLDRNKQPRTNSQYFNPKFEKSKPKATSRELISNILRVTRGTNCGVPTTLLFYKFVNYS